MSRSSVLKALTSRLALRDGFVVEALDGARQLTVRDGQVCFFDPDGAARTVTLDADVADRLGENGYWRFIYNAGAGGDGLTVTDGGDLSVVLADGQIGAFFVLAEGAGWDGYALVDTSTPRAIDDPGTGEAIPVTASGTVNLDILDAAETNTLAAPTFVGQRLVLNVNSRAGTGTRAITAAAAVNSTGNTVMTFNAAREMVTLEAILVADALTWQLVANVGSVALS